MKNNDVTSYFSLVFYIFVIGINLMAIKIMRFYNREMVLEMLEKKVEAIPCAYWLTTCKKANCGFSIVNIVYICRCFSPNINLGMYL